MRCWYTRWQMSNALDDAQLGARMDRGHAARCASCQAYGHALAELHHRLSHDAHAAVVPVVARRARRPWRLATPIALGAMGALAAIAIGLGVREDPARPAGPVAVIQPPQRSTQPPIDRSTEPSGPLVRMRGLADRVSQALAKTPLETELDDLIHDSKRGLDAVLATGGLRQP
jgi:hypothetical protein